MMRERGSNDNKSERRKLIEITRKEIVGQKDDRKKNE